MKYPFDSQNKPLDVPLKKVINKAATMFIGDNFLYSDIGSSVVHRGEILGLGVLKLAKSVLKPNSHILDIGANYGYVAAMLGHELARISPKGKFKVTCIEANPQIVPTLRRNLLHLFDKTQVEVCGVIASNINEEYKYHFIDYTKTDCLGSYDIESGPRIQYNQAVNKVRVDELLETELPVSLIKVDVEGHELEALEGCGSLIKKYKPALILEILPTTSSKLKNKLEDFLKEHNYYQKASYGADFLYLYQNKREKCAKILVTGCGRGGTNLGIELVRSLNYFNVTDKVEDRNFFKRDNFDLKYATKLATENLDFTTFNIQRILNDNPDMQVLFMVRHPIDICLSKILRGRPASLGGDSTVEIVAADGTLYGAVSAIRHMHKIYSFLKEEYESRIYVLKMEDLICSPDKEVLKICERFDIDHEKITANFYQNNRNQYQKKRYGNQLVQNVDLYKDLNKNFEGHFALKESEVEKLLSLFKDIIKDLGY